MRKGSLSLLAMCATLLWAGAIYSSPAAQGDQGNRGLITKTLTFRMPACPIKAATVPPTTTEFTLPSRNPLGAGHSVAGTVQVADQTGAVILKISGEAESDLNGFAFSRTVNTIAHMTGDVAFDRGCTSTDPYGSNNCAWTWGETISTSFQGALQEDVTSGKLVVDLMIDGNIPFAFACPVCGATCAITIPEQLDNHRWEKILRQMIHLIRFPLGQNIP